ncbi:MAG: bacillithiol biosynthesis cysteine-adding enzyme BshC [Taibaiella sp.]|nr:bacillithiol biosynthesis cysteine-adding enzyme BshC [Taibaiella sp.]
MHLSYTYLPYSDTGYFSRLVTDYLSGYPALASFFNYTPDKAGVDKAIAQRAQYPVNRELLADVLTTQYTHLTVHDKVRENIVLLRNGNTYTICTAHQPNLMTGYLYFIYKILHAIKLAEDLNKTYPGNNFVPVYYMGSEDNDLQELGTFRYGNEKYVWDGDNQQGAVGRMDTKSLKPLIETLLKVMGPPGDNYDTLSNIITNAYTRHSTIGAATQYLVNELFGRYGLLVLDPDDANLKRPFIPVMQDDLLHSTAYTIVSQQVEKLSPHYSIQAHPRPINLFYLTNNIRERIEKVKDTWRVVNTDIQFNEKELLAELEEHPERFSPNVILRGAFQETILPNVAFIGGGAEVAYWLQLRSLFQHYNVFYPAVLLRQSIQWIHPAQAHTRQQLQLSVPGVFTPEVTLLRNYVIRQSGDKWQTTEESAAIEKILLQLKDKATSLDVTLRASAEAALARMRHQLQVLEKKMLRAEKKKMQDQLLRISKLKNGLFPSNGLQERVDNFTAYYLLYGARWLDVLKDAIHPLDNQFLVVEDYG